MITRRFLGIAVLFVFLLFDRTATSSSAARAPSAPTNLRVTAVTETTISMSWNASTHNRPFTYRLRMTNNSNSQYNTVITVSQSLTSYTARYLPQSSSYSIAVYAVDDHGAQSANSNI